MSDIEPLPNPAIEAKVERQAVAEGVTLAMGVKPAPPNTNLTPQKNPYDIYGGSDASNSAADLAMEDEKYWTEQAILVKKDTPRALRVAILIMCGLVQVSWISIVITVITGVIGIVCAILFGSMAMLGYGLESFVDVFSSVMVVWR